MYSKSAIQDNVIVSHGTLFTCVPENLSARTIQLELLAQSLNLLHGSDESKIKTIKIKSGIRTPLAGLGGTLPREHHHYWLPQHTLDNHDTWTLSHLVHLIGLRASHVV